MSSTICNITFDCADPSALARFWGQVTGLPEIEEPQPGYPESAVGDSRSPALAADADAELVGPGEEPPAHTVPGLNACLLVTWVSADHVGIYPAVRKPQ